MPRAAARRFAQRGAVMLTGALFGLGCAGHPELGDHAPDWTPHVRVATQADSCGVMLRESAGGLESGLDASDIRVFNWNMQKGRDFSSIDDLDAFAGDKDLILIQEATLTSDLMRPFDRARFWSFSPGYRSGDALTGVMTLSATMPLTRCSFTSWEPWLRTPKATSVTEYALTGSEETLVVVNVHAVNFTIGTKRFREQFEQISAVLEGHEGPIILSGDFNTWRPKRMQIIDEMSARLALEPVDFDDDQRKLAFGQVLDHVYARGLRHVESSTNSVSTSDHNPMSVRFTHWPDVTR